MRGKGVYGRAPTRAVARPQPLENGQLPLQLVGEGGKQVRFTLSAIESGLV